MKKLLLISSLVASGLVAADAVPADKIEAITYTVTIFKDESDESFDKQAWNELVSLGSHAVKKAQDLEKDGDRINKDALHVVLDALNKSSEYFDRAGIHGALMVELIDESFIEEMQEKRCEGVCGGDERKDR